MKKLPLLIFSLVCTVFIFSECNDNKPSENAAAKDSTILRYGGYPNPVKYGQHLVTMMGCGDCHTPKKMSAMGPVDDSSLLLSGHPSKMPPPDVDRKAMESKGLGVTNDLTSWVGPWGVTYSANITSDTTGIGTWSEEQFILCLRQGKWKGLAASRPLLPPMPWQSFRNMTDDELKAMYAYLQSTKPIRNIEPPVEPPQNTPPH